MRLAHAQQHLAVLPQLDHLVRAHVHHPQRPLPVYRDHVRQAEHARAQRAQHSARLVVEARDDGLADVGAVAHLVGSLVIRVALPVARPPVQRPHAAISRERHARRVPQRPAAGGRLPEGARVGRERGRARQHPGRVLPDLEAVPVTHGDDGVVAVHHHVHVAHLVVVRRARVRGRAAARGVKVARHLEPVTWPDDLLLDGVESLRQLRVVGGHHLAPRVVPQLARHGHGAAQHVRVHAERKRGQLLVALVAALVIHQRGARVGRDDKGGRVRHQPGSVAGGVAVQRQLHARPVPRRPRAQEMDLRHNVADGSALSNRVAHTGGQLQVRGVAAPAVDDVGTSILTSRLAHAVPRHTISRGHLEWFVTAKQENVMNHALLCHGRNSYQFVRVGR
mmetsp:Transcript_28808/g.73451  ORF Transcript_28808/g.73451 Transcript_28808/m.73451 type:complete len:393 (+) Transcript_28808:1350-2528(+)